MNEYIRKQEASPKPVKPETLSHSTICEVKASSKVVGCAATNRVEGVGVKPTQAQEEIGLWPPAPLAGAQRYREGQSVPPLGLEDDVCLPSSHADLTGLQGVLTKPCQLSVNLASCRHTSQPGPGLQPCGFKGDILGHVVLELYHGSRCLTFPRGSIFLKLLIRSKNFRMYFPSTFTFGVFSLFYYIFFLFVYACMWHLAVAFMWRSEDNLKNQLSPLMGPQRLNSGSEVSLGIRALTGEPSREPCVSLLSPFLCTFSGTPYLGHALTGETCRKEPSLTIYICIVS